MRPIFTGSVVCCSSASLAVFSLVINVRDSDIFSSLLLSLSMKSLSGSNELLLFACFTIFFLSCFCATHFSASGNIRQLIHYSIKCITWSRNNVIDRFANTATNLPSMQHNPWIC